MPIKILMVLGTRPEAIKLLPVICALRDEKWADLKVCTTYQHRELLTQVLDLFDVKVDVTLPQDYVNQDQPLSLSQSQARMLLGLDKVIITQQPDLVIVHGDTSSCLAGALTAFYHQIPVVHIEAGLRTYNLGAPFPEESHRQMVARLADLHFVPTVQAKIHLVDELIAEDSIFVSGNTIVDSLHRVCRHVMTFPQSHFEGKLVQFCGIPVSKVSCPVILITLHRRESTGEKFRALCDALLQSAKANPHYIFIFTLHLNPLFKDPAIELSGKADNLFMIPPQDYLMFTWLLIRAELVITDSGGVQEEAEVLGKPLFIVRDHSDRPESLTRADVILIGIDPLNLGVKLNLFCGRARLPKSAPLNISNLSSCVFGDGNASQRILGVIKRKYLESDVCEGPPLVVDEFLN